MNVSSVGIELIKTWEGLRLQAYLCAAKVPTIGYGHTAGVKLGDTITSEKAEALLKEDITPIEEAISKKFPYLHQLMFDALTSFSFNVGLGWIKKSGMLEALEKRDFVAAADEFLRWNKAGGKPLAGLTRRRAAERELFLRGHHRSLEL